MGWDDLSKDGTDPAMLTINWSVWFGTAWVLPIKGIEEPAFLKDTPKPDRKSTRLNSSHYS